MLFYLEGGSSLWRGLLSIGGGIILIWRGYIFSGGGGLFSWRRECISGYNSITMEGTIVSKCTGILEGDTSLPTVSIGGGMIMFDLESSYFGACHF